MQRKTTRMSHEHTSNRSADSLQPTSDQNRVFSGVSYVLMWWSSLIVIQAFVLGQGFLPPIGKMNLMQSLLILVLAAVSFVAMFSLNGQAGMKYGIPYSIQARSGFGVRGSKIVEFLRAFPAIIWFGIGTWIAAMSFDAILTSLTGFTEPWAKFLYFAGFQALQVLLAFRGIRTMKWFNASSSIVIAAVMTYMMFHILNAQELKIEESWTSEGTWGTPFWVGLTAAIGVLATVMLNVSDMTRHLVKSQHALWFGHLVGVVPPWFFMLALGLIAGVTLGVWNPVQALMQLSPHPAAMVILLTFILLAQFTTNLTINILPPAMIFMDAFKVRWSAAVILTGVLGALSFPWLILDNSDAFFGFILYYSALFGPILGVMLCDYFVVRRRKLDVPALYLDDASSPHWHAGGFNIAGIVSIVVPGTVTMIWFLPMSWMIGLPCAFLMYMVLFPLLAQKA
ncbi:MAG: NCS1 family transporter [Xanthomonadales bacterium]|nr:NCS1 family transporter [Xanthomonadales bacterium]